MTKKQLIQKNQDERTKLLLLLVQAKRLVLLASERAGRDVTEQEHKLIDDINALRVFS